MALVEPAPHRVSRRRGAEFGLKQAFELTPREPLPARQLLHRGGVSQALLDLGRRLAQTRIIRLAAGNGVGLGRIGRARMVCQKDVEGLVGRRVAEMATHQPGREVDRARASGAGDARAINDV